MPDGLGWRRRLLVGVITAILVGDLVAAATIGGSSSHHLRHGGQAGLGEAGVTGAGAGGGGTGDGSDANPDAVGGAGGTGTGDAGAGLGGSGASAAGGDDGGSGQAGAEPGGGGTGGSPGGGGPAGSAGGSLLGGDFADSQGCLGAPSEAGAGAIAWDKLRNPILSYDSSTVRDIGIRLVHGEWHMAFTSLSGNQPNWRIATATTRDWSTWDPMLVWPAQVGTSGLASPDITRRPSDGIYVVTYQSDPGETNPPGPAKLYYRTSTDLVSWSAPHRLMAAIHAATGDRLIDAALAWTPHGLFLGYKYGTDQQHFEIAYSPSGSIDGPWTWVGRPNITVYGDTIENYQFLRIDGVWNLLATSNMFDRPWLFTLTGDSAAPSSWLNWSSGRELEVPAEAWNRAPGAPGINFELANSAYLCDARRIDGHFYLLYVGTNELTTYGGWGHTKLGVARSTDLVTWEVPCGPGGVSTPTGCAP